ncbi:unnamed protein product [Linum trigynum]|uniref:Uncharacterized protein n=1 Tax=Linum trigynum TaxID=586398 RepID=A0AAV2GJK1_9ROSI
MPPMMHEAAITGSWTMNILSFCEIDIFPLLRVICASEIVVEFARRLYELANGMETVSRDDDDTAAKL